MAMTMSKTMTMSTFLRRFMYMTSNPATVGLVS